MSAAAAAAAPAFADAGHTSVWTDTRRRFLRSPSALIGLIIVGLLAIFAIFALERDYSVSSLNKANGRRASCRSRSDNDDVGVHGQINRNFHFQS